MGLLSYLFGETKTDGTASTRMTNGESKLEYSKRHPLERIPARTWDGRESFYQDGTLLVSAEQLDKKVDYSVMTIEEINKAVPRNSYKVFLSEYYEIYYGFYCYIRDSINNRRLLQIAEAPFYYGEWFRGILAECIQNLYIDENWKKNNQIEGTLVERSLSKIEFICDNYDKSAYNAAFEILYMARDKEDYNRYLDYWRDKCEVDVMSNKWSFQAYFQAGNFEPGDYINGNLFSSFISLDLYLTDLGQSFYDEIEFFIAEELDTDFDHENINFAFKYANIEEKTMQLPIEGLAKFWPKHISNMINPESYTMKILSVNNAAIKEFVRSIENRVRKEASLPAVGETWISESVLFKQIEAIFNGELVEPHASPAFLGRQHYDIYLPDHKIAIEYQGEQHNKPVDFFGGQEGYARTVERDERKKELSKSNGVNLIYVYPGYDLGDIVKQVSEGLGNMNYYRNYEQMEIDESKLRTELQKALSGAKKLSTTKKKKIISPEEKQRATEKLAEINYRLCEGYWVTMWKYQFQVTNADALDLTPSDIDKLLQFAMENELSRARTNDCEASFADLIKRGINYYKKRGILEKAKALAEYAIDKDLKYADGSADFSKHLADIEKRMAE